MLELHSVRPYAETCFASGYWRRDPCAQYKPRHNQLLAALPPIDYERLLPHLEPVALPLGLTVHRAGERERHCYFLTAGTGREGVIGIASFLGGAGLPSQAVVVSAGYA